MYSTSTLAFWSAQGLANTRIEGHKPTTEFLTDCNAVVEGSLTIDQAIKASLVRATGREVANDTAPAVMARQRPAPARAKVAARGR